MYAFIINLLIYKLNRAKKQVILFFNWSDAEGLKEMFPDNNSRLVIGAISDTCASLLLMYVRL